MKLEKCATDRLKFLQKRVLDICKNLQKVNKWDGFHKYYEDKGDEIVKKYPAANKSALGNLRNISISSDPPDVKKGQT
jgi:hypothetical protein